MLFRASLFLILALGLANPLALAADETLTLLPHWKEGEHRAYAWSKLTRKVVGEKEAARQEVTSTIDLSVESVDDARILLNWTQGPRHFRNPDTDTDPFVRQYDAIFENQVIQLEIAPSTGQILSVKNWEEIRDRIQKGMELLFKDREGTDPKALASAREQVEAMLRTREQVESLSTKNAQIYVFPFGRQYTLKKSVITESAYPNPFGGEPIKSRSTLTLAAYDPATGEARLTWGQSSDPESVRNAIAAFHARLSKKLGGVPPQLQNLSLEIQDRAEFDLNARTGWIKKLTYTHSTKMGDSTQQDTTTFSPKEAGR